MEISYLLFKTAQEILAIPTSQARQVVPLERVSALPGTGGSILGLVSAAGRAVPVVNLAGLSALDLGTSELGLLCEHREEEVILPIDEVIGTVSDDAPVMGMQILQQVSLNYQEVKLVNLDVLLDTVLVRLQPI